MVGSNLYFKLMSNAGTERGADHLEEANDVEDKDDGRDGHHQEERHLSHLQFMSEAVFLLRRSK